MPDRSTAVSFLWHMHQPWYGDPHEPRFRLPWVRLHALKDYLDMVALLDEHPAVHVTFNLVPSLLLQIQRYVSGEYTDDVVELTRRHAGDLTDPERAWWMQTGFQINWARNIDPYPRYRQLLELRGRRTPRQLWPEKARLFGEQELRDLQVLFSLAWCGWELRGKDPLIRNLVARGRDFGEDDKLALLARLDEVLAGVLPRYREAAVRGQIEISTSPFYHPILPLLCRYRDVRAALPDVRLPLGLTDMPEDAAAQLGRGRALCGELVGVEPVGLWPSEGSVSTPAMELAAAAGFTWAATDEHILALSLQRRADPSGHTGRHPTADDLVRPHRHRDVALFFRHHYLSDRIGFDYYSWDPRAAVGDLLGQVENAANAARDVRQPVVSLILDGENCWEHYHRNGSDFLHALYGELERHPRLRATTFSEYLAEQPAPPTLDYLFPGSWIGHSFHIWAGHREDQRAWELLYAARAALVAAQDGLTEVTRTAAWEHIYIAEGSDWYWWFGEDNFSDDDPVFDALFRDHLKRVWELLGQTPPDALDQPIKGQAVVAPLVPPVAPFTPVLDGLETHFFEWRAAGVLGGAGVGGSMARSVEESVLRRVRYGFDGDHMYLSVEFQPGLNGTLGDTAELVLTCSAAGQDAELRVPDPTRVGLRDLGINGSEDHLAIVASDALTEISLALDALPAGPGDVVELAVAVTRDGQTLERWPSQGAFDVALPEANTWLRDWLV